MKKNKYINLFCKEVFGETGQSEGPADIICIGQKPDLDRVLDALSDIDVELLDTRFAPSGVADPEKYQVMHIYTTAFITAQSHHLLRFTEKK